MNGEGAPKRPLEVLAAKPGPHKDTPADRTDVTTDELLEIVRRYRLAARLVADDPSLSMIAKCRALLELQRRARRETHLPHFAELSVWGGARHLWEKPATVPRDEIAALRRLLRKGLNRCPECRRRLPDHEELDSWELLEIRAMGSRTA